MIIKEHPVISTWKKVFSFHLCINVMCYKCGFSYRSRTKFVATIKLSVMYSVFV